MVVLLWNDFMRKQAVRDTKYGEDSKPHDGGVKPRAHRLESVVHLHRFPCTGRQQELREHQGNSGALVKAQREGYNEVHHHVGAVENQPSVVIGLVDVLHDDDGKPEHEQVEDERHGASCAAIDERSQDEDVSERCGKPADVRRVEDHVVAF